MSQKQLAKQLRDSGLISELREEVRMRLFNEWCQADIETKLAIGAQVEVLDKLVGRFNAAANEVATGGADGQS